MSNRSKALCRKQVRKSHKIVKKLLRNQKLYNDFANFDDSIHEEYFKDNLDEKQLGKMWVDLEKFSDSFEKAGGKPEKFKDYVLSSFAFNPEIIKDINNRVK